MEILSQKSGIFKRISTSRGNPIPKNPRDDPRFPFPGAPAAFPEPIPWISPQNPGFSPASPPSLRNCGNARRSARESLGQAREFRGFFGSRSWPGAREEPEQQLRFPRLLLEIFRDYFWDVYALIPRGFFGITSPDPDLAFPEEFWDPQRGFGNEGLGSAFPTFPEFPELSHSQPGILGWDLKDPNPWVGTFPGSWDNGKPIENPWKIPGIPTRKALGEPIPNPLR